MKTTINYIGRTNGIKGWPEVGTIAGLLDALSRWKLDPRWAMDDATDLEIRPDRLPYRSLHLKWVKQNDANAWTVGKKWDANLQREIYVSGPPLDPDAPTALSYLGNFLHYSFAFSVVTDDPQLIATLNAAILDNMEKFS